MNEYLLKIKEIANNKYVNWYVSIISTGIVRVDNNIPKYKQKQFAEDIIGYSERHHIYPRCLCESHRDELNKLNIVHLTAREHFICHWLLCKIFPTNRKLMSAFGCFIRRSNNQERILTSRMYETSKYYKVMSQLGVTHSIEHRMKNSKSNKGRKLTEEHKENIRQSKIGHKRPAWVIEKTLDTKKKLNKKRSSESRERTSLASTGANNGNAKHWVIISPDGTTHTGCLTDIARSLGMNYNRLYYILRSNPEWIVKEKG